jgi:hypothetical protein
MVLIIVGVGEQPIYNSCSFERFSRFSDIVVGRDIHTPRFCTATLSTRQLIIEQSIKLWGLVKSSSSAKLENFGFVGGWNLQPTPTTGGPDLTEWERESRLINTGERHWGCCRIDRYSDRRRGWSVTTLDISLQGWVFRLEMPTSV